MRIFDKIKKVGTDEKGQAFAETAIVITVFLMIVVGIIQFSLVMNAKFLVNYAAHCAARAGIVHNGNADKMKQAAAVALAPLFTKSRRGHALGYLRAYLSDNDKLKVEIVSPEPARFSADYSKDNRYKRFFPVLKKYSDGYSELDNNLLIVKVIYDFPLEVPFINRIMSPQNLSLKIASTCQMRMQSDSEIK
jgi:hypothetical protein